MSLTLSQHPERQSPGPEALFMDPPASRHLLCWLWIWRPDLFLVGCGVIKPHRVVFLQENLCRKACMHEKCPSSFHLMVRTREEDAATTVTRIAEKHLQYTGPKSITMQFCCEYGGIRKQQPSRGLPPVPLRCRACCWSSFHLLWLP